MTFADTLAWQRVNAEKIKRLAELDDPLAKRLIASYRALYDDRLNPAKQADWMAVCDDYCRRDLTYTTRAILQERYGHKIPREFKVLH